LAGGNRKKQPLISRSLPLSGFAATDKSVSRSDLDTALCDGPDAILVAGQLNFPAERPSLVSIPKSVAPGSNIFVGVLPAALSASVYFATGTLPPADIPRLIFSHDLFEHRTKGNLGTDCAASIWCREKSLPGKRLFLLARILVTVSFLFTFR